MATESVPELTDKQLKDLKIISSICRPSSLLWTQFSSCSFHVTALDPGGRSNYGEWHLYLQGGCAHVAAILGDRELTWHMDVRELNLDWGRVTQSLLDWQKAINGIELDAYIRRDPRLRHLTPDAVSDPRFYTLPGAHSW